MEQHQQEITGNGTAEVTIPVERMLNADCWEKVFDYLSLKDINSMSQTCKWLKETAGYYVQVHLSGVCGEIYVDCSKSAYRHYIYLQTNGLTEFINKLYVRFSKDARIKMKKALSAKSFASVKSLKLDGMSTDLDCHLDFIKNILGNIETLKIVNIKDRNNCFGQLLQQCPKLRNLHLKAFCELNSTWLHKRYPNLENVTINTRTYNPEPRGSDVLTFLMNNANIKRFGIDSDFMWQNRREFAAANVQLDALVIDFSFFRYWEQERSMCDDYYFYDNDDYDDDDDVGFIEFVTKLQDRQFYKSLHVRSYYEDERFFNSIAQLNLNTIHVINMHKEINTDISQFVNLKELHTPYFNFSDTELETLAKSFVQLEKIYIEMGCVNRLLPFVRYSKHLRFLRVGVVDRPRWVLDLWKLNSAREMLKNELHGCNPSIVFVYLNEADYLATHWHMKNVCLELVRLERIERIAGII